MTLPRLTGELSDCLCVLPGFPVALDYSSKGGAQTSPSEYAFHARYPLAPRQSQ